MSFTPINESNFSSSRGLSNARVSVASAGNTGCTHDETVDVKQTLKDNGISAASEEPVTETLISAYMDRAREAMATKMVAKWELQKHTQQAATRAAKKAMKDANAATKGHTSPPPTTSNTTDKNMLLETEPAARPIVEDSNYDSVDEDAVPDATPTRVHILEHGQLRTLNVDIKTVGSFLQSDFPQARSSEEASIAPGESPTITAVVPIDQSHNLKRACSPAVMVPPKRRQHPNSLPESHRRGPNGRPGPVRYAPSEKAWLYKHVTDTYGSLRKDWQAVATAFNDKFAPETPRTPAALNVVWQLHVNETREPDVNDPDGTYDKPPKRWTAELDGMILGFGDEHFKEGQARNLEGLSMAIDAKTASKIHPEILGHRFNVLNEQRELDRLVDNIPAATTASASSKSVTAMASMSEAAPDTPATTTTATKTNSGRKKPARVEGSVFNALQRRWLLEKVADENVDWDEIARSFRGRFKCHRSPSELRTKWIEINDTVEKQVADSKVRQNEAMLAFLNMGMSKKKKKSVETPAGNAVAKEIQKFDLTDEGDKGKQLPAGEVQDLS